MSTNALFELGLNQGFPSRPSDTLIEAWRNVAPGLGSVVRSINVAHQTAPLVVPNISPAHIGAINQAADFSLSLRQDGTRILRIVNTLDSPSGLSVRVLQNFFRELLFRLLQTWKPMPGFKTWHHRKLFARCLVLMARTHALRFFSIEKAFDYAGDLPWDLGNVCATHQPLKQIDAKLKRHVPEAVANEADALIAATQALVSRRGYALYQRPFRGCGILSGGAGDLIIGDTLIELKCVVSPRGLDKSALQQLLSYCVLNHLSNEDFLPLRKIALLNPRRGFQWRASIDDVCKDIGACDLKTLAKRFLPALKKDLPLRALKEVIASLPPFLRRRYRSFLKALE